MFDISTNVSLAYINFIFVVSILDIVEQRRFVKEHQFALRVKNKEKKLSLYCSRAPAILLWVSSTFFYNCFILHNSTQPQSLSSRFFFVSEWDFFLIA